MKITLINGQAVQQADVNALVDGSFFHGSRIMTTMLARGALVVDFARHLGRLAEHAYEMQFQNIPKDDLLRFEIDSALASLGYPDNSKVRIIFFEQLGTGLNRVIQAERIDGTKDLGPSRPGGLRLATHVERFWQRGSHVKTGVLGLRWTAIKEAQKQGFDDVLWVNGDGELAEATWANVFLIGRTGDLVEIATPAPACGLLLGIVRQRISELLVASKIPVTERVITLDEVPRFDEAFVTSSIQGLVPVQQIDKHRLQTLRPQAVFNHIARLYGTWLSTQKFNDVGDLIKNTHPGLLNN